MTAPVSADWRGVAAESVEGAPGGLTGFLRARSRRLLGALLRPHRRALLVLGAVSVLQNVAAMSGPYLVKVGIDRGIPAVQRGDGAGPLVAVVAVFLAAAGAEALLTAVFVRRSAVVGQAVLLDLRTRLFGHFQALSISFHEDYTSGRVISRLTSDVEALGDLLNEGVAQLVFAVLSVVTTAVLLLLLDVPIALVALLSFPALVALTLWFRRQAEKAYRAGRVAVAQVIVQFVESMAGIRVVQAFRREDRNQEIFEEVNARYRDANAWSGRLAAAFGPGTRAIGGVTFAVVLAFGAWRVVGGAVTVGVLAASLLYVRRFFEPMQDLVQFLNSFQSATAALEKLSGVLEEEPAVPAPDAPEAPPAGPCDVRFRHVSFAYRPGRPVLHDLDLVIPAGQTVAVVGATGAGKSTVARLLARFYDPAEGEITLGGVDVRDLTDDDLRRVVGMVTQENFLFTGSVADNIALGRPGASRAEIEDAARAIGAHAQFAALPQGYDSPVGKRGGRLSAGQRQLVAFARAFLAGPRVLILDEATSSLDVPSERLVQQALATLLAERTAVIIAHRLSTVEIAHRVLVVDGGRIVEDGPPQALLRDGGRYADLHRAWAEGLA
ncbi:MAG TPA: ABC transporter ATP-binding protein [Acidimicrobiales bacterium]|nr:ABC transporter ATP-binding protein [Acidimicrobiales bacterium]